MPLAEVVFAESSVREIWSRNRAKGWLLQALQWCLEVLWRLCESCFQKYMARRWLL